MKGRGFFEVLLAEDYLLCFKISKKVGEFIVKGGRRRE